MKDLLEKRDNACKVQNSNKLQEIENEIFAICRERGMHSIAVKHAVCNENLGNLDTCYMLCDDEVKTMVEGIENIHEMVDFIDENRDLYIEVYAKPNVIDKKIDFSEEFLATINDDSVPFKEKLF